MKILEINTEKTWRGGERQTLYNIQGFLQQGLQVELLCRKGYPLAEKARAAGIKTIEVSGNLQVFSWLISNGNKYDIIHVQTAKAQTAAVFTKTFHRTPVVYTRRLDFVPSGNLTKWKYDRTDKVVAISTPVKKILESFGVKQVDVVYDVVVPRSLNKKRAQEIISADISGNKKVIMSLSALVPHKDPITMVETIKELSLLRNDFIFLHFGEGELKDKVQERIRGYKLGYAYHLKGFIPEAEDLYSMMDVFCMSSEEEGLGSSVLDAFVYEVPVVSTNAGGLSEIVEGRGLVADVKDAKKLAKYINEILENPASYSDMKVKAKEYALQYHSLKSTTEQYVEIFSKLIKQK